MSKQFLDNSGLQIVADNTNTRLKTVTTMPLTASPGAVRLYVGEDTADYKKGHIYKATGNYWYCYQTRSEEYIYIKNKFPPEVNDYFWVYFLNGLWVIPSDESQLEEANIITRVIAKGRVIDIDVSGYETNIRYPQNDINNLVWEDITVSGGTADLNFDPTSQNAQSGIAVSQALKQVVSENTKTDWEDAPWFGDFTGYGMRIWTDEDNVYYSDNGSNYILNKSTSTWEEKTWTGPLISFNAEYIWNDTDNVYYSDSSDQYVLNKISGEWEEKTWYGLTSFDSRRIWSDGSNIYYSYGSDQYVLNRATSTWEEKTWQGLTYFWGNYIWSDGSNIYYSYGSEQYVLNKETSTWEPKTWYGLTSFNGYDIWTDGTDVYCLQSQYVLNKETSTWEITNPWGSYHPNASYIWKDGNNVYVSAGDYEQKQMIRVVK